MAYENVSGKERRQYIRLDSVFPVQFRLTSADGKTAFSDWIQGFTHNVSRGGLLVDVNTIKAETATALQQDGIYVEVRIRLPLHAPVSQARARVAWIRPDPQEPDAYCFGLRYDGIDPLAQSRIMAYVQAKRLAVPLTLVLIAILGGGFALNGYLNMRLAQGNKALVGQLIKILQESMVAKQKIKDINSEKQNLQLKMDTLAVRIKTIEAEKLDLEQKAHEEQARSVTKAKDLNAMIEKLNLEKSALQEQLIGVQRKENAVTEELLQLDRQQAVLEKANIDRMYRWLTVHQTSRSGLVMSFEGDADLANWGFLYDQSLAAQAYTYFSDFERARRIFDFFQKRAKRASGLFVNAYYVTDGQPAEYIVHSGPNIWLGIALAHYTHKAQDNRYLALAEEIAGRIMELQGQDEHQGIRGGPDTGWYSTEHNLDAYAFFKMLAALTGKPAYEQAASRTLAWLVQHAYDKQEVPIMRGKGDATIATDTYAWSIAAVGPATLQEIGMNPDQIMEFAEQNCRVSVSYVRPDGQTISVKGFDFAPQRHVARGGVVSSEWTAQMVISFKIMADYYRAKNMPAKARQYEEKADEYLAQVCNLIVSSPSPTGQGQGCLPYASCDFVDSGHGWMTPKGKTTGSVAGTAYTIFAYYNYNPLVLKE